MKMKLKELVASQEALAKLRSLDLKPKFGFIVKRATKGAVEVLKDYHESRAEIIKKHSTKNDDGIESVVPNSPAEKKAEKELNDMLSAEIEFVVKPISEGDFCSNVKEFKANDIDRLDWLFLESGQKKADLKAVKK